MWGWILENLTRISFENLVLCENICHWNGNQTIIHVQFYHLHILMTLDSFKQLWEPIFFKCKGYIFKGKPSSSVEVCKICPLDHCKPTRCCYLGPPLLLWMGMVEVGGSTRNGWWCPVRSLPGSWAPSQLTQLPCGDPGQGCCQNLQGSSLNSAGSLVGRCCCLLVPRRRASTTPGTAEGVEEISLTLQAFVHHLAEYQATKGIN